MYLRKCYRAKDGKRHAYWALVKSVRTAKGPRQEIVAYLGDLDEAGRLGVQQVADNDNSLSRQRELFDTPQPRFVEVDLSGVVVEGTRKFGGPWLALQLIGKLGLKSELDRLMPIGREDVPWPIMSLALVICRLCDPSSELRIAEHLYERSAMPDLLGVGPEKINDDRLYRALDELLPHKAALETHLKQRLGELFNLSYDLLLYDVTPVVPARLAGAMAMSRPSAATRATAAATASRSASGRAGTTRLRHAARIRTVREEQGGRDDGEGDRHNDGKAVRQS